VSDIGIIKDVFSTEQIGELLRVYMSDEMVAEGWMHGTKHAFRCMLIASRILKEIPQAEPAVVICAATFHDVGRVHDGADPLHGYRGVPRVLSIMDALKNPQYPNFQTGAWEVIKGKVAEIVAGHSFPGPGIGINAQVMRDANKLDRVRFGEDALDVSRLALDVSKELIGFALDLVDSTGE
jgi:hypothetical protein